MWASEAQEVRGSRAQPAVVVAANKFGIASLARVSCSSVAYPAVAGYPDVGLELEDGLRETRQQAHRQCHSRFR